MIVTLKEGAFETSFPLCHAAELKQLLDCPNSAGKPILCLYTDGGPDHCIAGLTESRIRNFKKAYREKLKHEREQAQPK